MAKKQSTIKKVKKAVKPAKVTKAFKKEKPKKVGKNIKAKPSHPSGGKASKPAPKLVKKKVIAKKVSKPVKKAIKTGNTKSAKPVKKVAEKKPLKKVSSKANSKIISKKSEKSVKEIVKKTTVLVIPVKNTVAKSAKPAKPAKAEKPSKPAKPEKAAKKEKAKKGSDDEDDDFVKPVKKSKGGRKPKNKNDDDDEPIVENDILIEQLINSTKRLKKPSKIPKQLRTFTNPMASLTVAKLVDNKKGAFVPKKEPKGKFELEYVLHTSAGILYEFLTSPSGLAEWFADDVNIHDGVFTFFWEGSEQKAKLLGFKDDKFVRLQWLDKPEGTYFEFRIERDELTGDISLIITDFADEGADLKTSKLLWDSQINQLLHVIGSY